MRFLSVFVLGREHRLVDDQPDDPEAAVSETLDAISGSKLLLAQLKWFATIRSQKPALRPLVRPPPPSCRSLLSPFCQRRPNSSLFLLHRRRLPLANPEPHQPPRRPSRITGETNYYSHGEQWHDDSKTTLPPRNIGSLFRRRALSARRVFSPAPFAFFGDKYARATSRIRARPRERYLSGAQTENS